MPETCFICQSTAVLIEEPRKAPWGERLVVIQDRFYRCEGCGETFYAGEMADETSRRVTEALLREMDDGTGKTSAPSLEQSGDSTYC